MHLRREQHPGFYNRGLVLKSASRRLNLVVAANLFASTAHFTDNAVRFVLYPEPRWISSPLVVVALWLAITPLLLAGWWLARREHFRLAAGAFGLYSLSSLFVVGHYAYAPVTTIRLSVHITIVANALAALALMLGAPPLLREMRRSG